MPNDHYISEDILTQVFNKNNVDVQNDPRIKSIIQTALESLSAEEAMAIGEGFLKNKNRHTALPFYLIALKLLENRDLLDKLFLGIECNLEISKITASLLATEIATKHLDEANKGIAELKKIRDNISQ